MAVLTYKNVPGWKAGMPRHVPVLDSKVRFVGDAVAIVAAETEEIASKALDLIDVEYEQLPAVYDVEEAMVPGVPQLHDDFLRNLVPLDIPTFEPLIPSAEAVSGPRITPFSRSSMHLHWQR
jgi:xanthine dehydrogenase molybdenum-binding subunit